MGFLDRLRGRRESPVSQQANAGGVPATVLDGRVDLEVVGESHHQDVLWRLSGRTPGERVRCNIVAVLVPEPTNPYDANAISVQIDGEAVGYLSRTTAQAYLPGLKRAMSSHRAFVGLHGVIVGGGYYQDGPGRLGVWLKHDPADFGLEPAPLPHTGSPGYLSWLSDLPEADRPAIAKLHQLLAADAEPIVRHFQFSELENRLYRSRDLYESALSEYDDACVQHDAEMEGICNAFMAKWGEVPLLDTYRQMAIRQQKKGDWAACKWWAERGLALYGQRGARQEAVEDLIKRRNRAVAKLEATVIPRRQVHYENTHQTELEVLVCHECGRRFERMRVRGRKPTLCPQCRAND